MTGHPFATASGNTPLNLMEGCGAATAGRGPLSAHSHPSSTSPIIVKRPAAPLLYFSMTYDRPTLWLCYHSQLRLVDRRFRRFLARTALGKRTCFLRSVVFAQIIVEFRHRPIAPAFDFLSLTSALKTPPRPAHIIPKFNIPRSNSATALSNLFSAPIPPRTCSPIFPIRKNSQELTYQSYKRSIKTAATQRRARRSEHRSQWTGGRRGGRLYTFVL